MALGCAIFRITQKLMKLGHLTCGLCHDYTHYIPLNRIFHRKTPWNPYEFQFEMPLDPIRSLRTHHEHLTPKVGVLGHSSQDRQVLSVDPGPSVLIATVVVTTVTSGKLQFGAELRAWKIWFRIQWLNLALKFPNWFSPACHFKNRWPRSHQLP